MKKTLIERKFWGSSENSEDDDPQKILRIFRKFWGSSENSEDPQKILRMTILRKFWGWGSSENSEDDDPQKILRILRKFWGWRSSENSEDEDPQKILSIRILRKFWGWRSSENSEGPQKFLRMTILRKFWGFFRFFVDNHQKFRLMTIPIIIGYIRCSSARRSLQKKNPRAKSSTKHGPIVYTDNTQCVLLVLLFFPDHQSYIFFKIDQSMMIIIKCIWYSITRYIQRLSEWWTLANLILKGETTVILYTYSTRCLTCCVCLFFRAQNYLMHVAKMISW